MNRFEYELTVTPDVIDVLGHVNNIEYVRWIQDVALKHSDAVGLTWDVYQALGAAFVIRRHAIEYLQPAHVGDVLRVATWIESNTRITAVRATEIRNARGDVLVTARTTWVFIALDGLRPRRIPPQIAEAFGGAPGAAP